jgi:hypothetical protein
MRCLSGRRRSHWATKGFQAPGGAYGDDRQAETKCGGFHCDMVVRMGLTDMTSGCASQLWAHKLRALFGSLINVTATTLSQIRSRHLSVFFLTQTTILAHPQVRSILAFDLPWYVSPAISVRHFQETYRVAPRRRPSLNTDLTRSPGMPMLRYVSHPGHF